MYVGIGMVQKIVFLTPQKIAAPHEVEGEPHDPAEFGILCIRPVCAIVHDIEADQTDAQCHAQHRQTHTPIGVGIKYQMGIKRNHRKKNDARFKKHAPCAGFGQVRVFKVAINLIIQIGLKLGSGWKFNAIHSG